VIYGYARVSTDGQSEAAQVRQLRAAGAKTDRSHLRRLLAEIGPGDVVMVTRIDRLARSTLDLFGIVKRIVDERRNSGSWLSRGPTSAPAPGGLMLAVLGGLVDVERDLIRTRTAEGRSRAQKRGQHMGRPPKLTPGATGRSPPTTGAGRDARRTGAQL
jgi:DNA invertase Pin-like site-specific DNA recombinase